MQTSCSLSFFVSLNGTGFWFGAKPTYHQSVATICNWRNQAGMVPFINQLITHTPISNCQREGAKYQRSPLKWVELCWVTPAEDFCITPNQWVCAVVCHWRIRPLKCIITGVLVTTAAERWAAIARVHPSHLFSYSILTSDPLRAEYCPWWWPYTPWKELNRWNTSNCKAS